MSTELGAVTRDDSVEPGGLACSTQLLEQPLAATANARPIRQAGIDLLKLAMARPLHDP
jgi:hypothetical protein